MENNIIIVNIGGLQVYLKYYKCNCNPQEVSVLWESLPEKCRESSLIVGLDRKIYDPCSISIAFLHALEWRLRGSRIRKLPLIFLMELLGKRQLREVVNVSGEFNYLVNIALSNYCMNLIDSIILNNINNLKTLNPPSCREEEMWKITSQSVVNEVRFRL